MLISMGLAPGLYFCCACAENPPKLSSAKETPARPRTRAAKTRRLKNPPSPKFRRARADCEVDFFFMGGYEVDRVGFVKRLAFS
jgi:hypothetical protein